ncbi:unnamed protein product [Discula destructiva]
MATSSPLAAMHPQAPSFGHPDMFRSQAALNGESRGSNMLFRDRIMPKSRPDYFNVKGVHGSSPTASLVADLSQNFRIDSEASPRFPTPRRALFTTNNIMNAFDGRGYQTTPPLPATSSPGMDMDISPVPMHKGAYVAEVEIHSPTPLAVSDDDDEDMMLESPAPITRRTSAEAQKLADRCKMNLRRPSLSRAKGYSTSAMPSRLHSEGQVSGFKFGAEDRPGSSSSNLSLSECFEDSPPQERRMILAASPCSGVGRSSRIASLSAAPTRNGSPITSQSRRLGGLRERPRKAYRRSLSMFENSGDVINPKEDINAQPKLQSVMDMEEPAELVLPHFFPDGPNDSIPRISRTTFLDILDGKYDKQYDNRLIVDSRFEYEYEGGHVDGAVNYNDKELLASQLFENPPEGRTLLVFHCEYSAHRAPLMARHVRSEDRIFNAECYPRLTYPELYILDGGYSNFFSEHRERCYPQAYVEMDAAEHANTCEKEMDRLRQNRKGLGRAQTYAFGEKTTVRCESPAASLRNSFDESPMQLGDSPSCSQDRNHARRMASY